MAGSGSGGGGGGGGVVSGGGGVQVVGRAAFSRLQNEDGRR